MRTAFPVLHKPRFIPAIGGDAITFLYTRNWSRTLRGWGRTCKQKEESPQKEMQTQRIHDATLLFWNTKVILFHYFSFIICTKDRTVNHFPQFSFFSLDERKSEKATSGQWEDSINSESFIQAGEITDHVKKNTTRACKADSPIQYEHLCRLFALNAHPLSYFPLPFLPL